MGSCEDQLVELRERWALDENCAASNGNVSRGKWGPDGPPYYYLGKTVVFRPGKNKRVRDGYRDKEKKEKREKKVDMEHKETTH